MIKDSLLVTRNSHTSFVIISSDRRRIPASYIKLAAVTTEPDIPGIRITGAIGEGGFATVYCGWQTAVGREVAVKVDSRVLVSERDRRRFVREVNAAGRLSGHSHVVDIYDAGTLNDGRPYMVMEFCPGGSLADAVRRNGVMSPAQVCDIGAKIADALAAAHAADVLHRDIKPANILINRYGLVSLSDFGLASIVAPGREQSVTLEALTPAYASPERFRGHEPTVACDLYSLAATLYSLLAGRPPRFPADGRNLSIAMILSLHSRPVEDIPGVPSALMSTLRATLAVDPMQRPRSAEELRDALAAPASESRPRPAHRLRTAATPQAGRAAGKLAGRGALSTAIARRARKRPLADTITVNVDRAASRRRPKARLAVLAALAAAPVVIAAAALLPARELLPGAKSASSASESPSTSSAPSVSSTPSVLSVPFASSTSSVSADVCSAPSLAAVTTSAPSSSSPRGSFRNLRQGSKVSVHQTVTGVITGLPRNDRAWIIVTPWGEPTCWPQRGSSAPGQTGSFQASATFGIPKNSGEHFTAWLVMASPAASAFFLRFVETSHNSGLRALPTGVQVLAKVTVIRS